MTHNSLGQVPAVCLDSVRKQDLISEIDVLEVTFPCLDSEKQFRVPGLAKTSREGWSHGEGNRNNAGITSKKKKD